jgi:hypothetical protein
MSHRHSPIQPSVEQRRFEILRSWYETNVYSATSFCNMINVGYKFIQNVILYEEYEYHLRNLNLWSMDL